MHAGCAMNPELPRDERTVRGLVLEAIAVPVGLVLLVPLILLIAAWFYLSACKEGLPLLLVRSVRCQLAARDDNRATGAHLTTLLAPGAGEQA